MSYIIETLLQIARSEVGYLEKKTYSQLNNKTQNSGQGNFTKYWEDTKNWGYGNYQGQYWCAAFIFWCFVKAYGQDAAKKLLLHAPYISCATLGSKAKSNGSLFDSPKVGDVVLFHNGSRFYHTGLIYSVTGNRFYTVEGNTSDGSNVVANGGGVAEKSYAISTARTKGHRFMRPLYGQAYEVANASTSQTASKSNNVSKGQKWLNENYAVALRKYCGGLLSVDGVFGKATKAACLAVWKDLTNRKYGSNLSPSNPNFGTECKSIAGKATVKVNSSGTYTYIVELLLSAKGYYTGAMDGACGAQVATAVKQYQSKNGLKADGICGANTWSKLFS
jgi:peptidoglycan hydrolase-like protein with peptidoglycan-binding domain